MQSGVQKRERFTRSSRVTAYESLLTHWPGCNTILNKSAHSHWHAYTRVQSAFGALPSNAFTNSRRQTQAGCNMSPAQRGMWAWEGDGHGHGKAALCTASQIAGLENANAANAPCHPAKLPVRQCQSQRYIHQATDMGPDRQKLVTWPGCI